MKEKTHLEKNVEAFLKDEYDLKSIDVKLKLKNPVGTDLTRLKHDSLNDFDFDLID